MEIKHCWNPITLSDGDCKAYNIPDRTTPNQIIQECGLTFRRPFILIVNGEAIDRNEWDVFFIYEEDTVHFVELPGFGGGGGGSNPLRALAFVGLMLLAPMVAPLLGATSPFWSAVITGLVTIGGSMLINALLPPTSPTGPSLPEVDQPYYLQSSNQLRLGSPFVEHFGRIRLFPDLVQGSYTQYEPIGVVGPQDRVMQHLYFLGVIGVGEYDIEDVCIDKTPIDDFAGSSYAIIEPGVIPSIVSYVVYTTTAISGQEVPDEDPLVAIVNPAGTSIWKISLDITWPGGFYYMGDEGDLGRAGMRIYASIRTVGNDGTPISSWSQVVNKLCYGSYPEPTAVTIEFLTPDPTARYEIRVWRSEKNFDRHVCYTCYAGDIRAFGPSQGSYGDVTLLEARLRASKQLTGQVTNKINVIATRKLYQVESSGFGSVKIPTRSPVDAAAYVVTCDNGGRQPDTVVDWEAMVELRNTLESAGYYFDHRFQQRVSVMEAISTIALVGRAFPYMPGGKFTLIQDREQASPARKFTRDDYTEGSFSIEHLYRTADSPTGVEIHYIDADTWQSDKVVCYDLVGSTENLAVRDLTGCTNRQHAYDIGMYLYKEDRYNRSFVSFTTGLKGHLPIPSERVLVELPSVDFQRSGFIHKIDGSNIHLSEEVDFGDSETGLLYLSDNTGGLLGPFTVSPGAEPHIVVGDLGEYDDSSSAQNATLEETPDGAVKYLFALNVSEMTSIRVTKVEPAGQNSVRISGSIYNSEVYLDPGTAPESGVPMTEYIEGVRFQFYGVVEDNWPIGGDYIYYIQWQGLATEVRIELDIGTGYTIVADHFTEAYKTITTFGPEPYVRITPYVNGVLRTSMAEVLESDAIHTPQNVDIDVSGFGLGVTITASWDAVTDAVSYIVYLYSGSTEQGHFYTAGTSYTFDKTSASRSYDVYVAAVDAAGFRGLAGHASYSPPAEEAPTQSDWELYGGGP